jgi:DNA-binding LacI/PurR family transcriptional regulator
MATIKDVAARAGVSVATVSHVINNTRFVTPELRDRVTAAMQELAYEPNPVARGLRSNRTNLIALVIPDICNPYFPELARGVQDVANQNDYVTILGNTDRGIEPERRLLHILSRQHVEGVIINPSGVSAEDLLPMQSAGIPVVIFGHQIDHPAFDSVMIDDCQAARELVHHLIEQGHRRIAHLCSHRPNSGQLRYAGFAQALQERGLSPDPQLITEGPWTQKGGYLAMRVLLECRPVPTAVFAANDLMAIGAMMAIHDAGLHVPQDIAVAGFDNIDQAASVSPALTTVHQPKYEMGRKLAETLFARLRKEAPDTPQRIILPYSLEIRESTCAGAASLIPQIHVVAGNAAGSE